MRQIIAAGQNRKDQQMTDEMADAKPTGAAPLPQQNQEQLPQQNQEQRAAPKQPEPVAPATEQEPAKKS
jgi:hypothetical protein